MASLKCSNCGNGIHYHDEANGTQYIIFNEKVWERLVNSDLYVSRYLLDGNEKYYLGWKCNQCGAIHIFNNDSAILLSSYKKAESKENNFLIGERYIAFSDIDWDTITETQIYGRDIIEKHPYCTKISIIQNNERFWIYNSNGFKVNSYYESIPIME